MTASGVKALIPQMFTTLHRRPECVIAQRIRAQLTEASELWHD